MSLVSPAAAVAAAAAVSLLTTNNKDARPHAQEACLSLLLLRADASSYGFTVAGNDSPLVHARGYVNNNVVNASRNDPNSMHNSEVLCPRMDNLSTHTLDGYRTLFTTPLHESQSSVEVHTLSLIHI